MTIRPRRQASLPEAPARRSLRAGIALLGAIFGLLAILPATSRADALDPCAPPVASAVACENSKPGTSPGDWSFTGAGDPSIQGFATRQSVNVGDTVDFKIKSDTSDFHIDILRLGYYGGMGARKLAAGLTPTGPSTQPDCLTDATTGVIDCANWSVTASWTVPSDAVSGVYMAHLVRNDTGGESRILFVVRNDASHSDIVLQTSDATWQAYNNYGGNSLYQCTTVNCPPGHPQVYKGAYAVSYNRPLLTADGSALFSGAEYSMIRFLEQNGYDVSYITASDVASRGSLLLNHKVFMDSGHDEYWSASQRASMEAARAAGVNLAFFSGNTGFWKTRWAPDANGTPDRTLISYKDTHFNQRTDPVTWTGSWRDSRFLVPSDGVTPENALDGQSFLVNTGTSAITVPYAYHSLRIWRNTDVAGLSSGGSVTLGTNTLGYEWDQDADNGFRPAGEVDLSSTTVSPVEVFTDYGNTTKFGQTATHNLTLYRAPSGALVFNSGTVQWAWGLSEWNPSHTPPDDNMQQATVNLLADLGAQPETLESTLVGAAASSDTTPPTASIDPLPASVADGTRVNVTGSAADTGGGVVAGVEISTDGGTTWHPATGTTSWSYSWVAHGAPAATVKVRATDDSGNTGLPSAGQTVNVTCPCSLWGVNVTPDTPDAGDPTAVEVGVKFTADKYGTVSGIRFYKSAANTGTHLGSLWTADGTRLALATFQSESATGWQTVTFASPVTVQANTTYVASYYAPSGHYAATPGYFYPAPSPGPNGGATVDVPPLHGVRNAGGVVNGVYRYGSSSVFPTNTFNASNYWVDVLYTPTPLPGAVSGVTAVEGGRTSANITWNAPASGGTVTSYRITPYIGGVAQTPMTAPADATTQSISGLTTGTTYTFTVAALNPNGAGPESGQSNPVTPSVPVIPAAPSVVVARPGSNMANVTWNLPDSDGDSAITGQTVTPYVNGTAQTPVQVGASATSATVTGLTDGTAYTFKVSATNGVGTGPQSLASNAVTPNGTIFDFMTPQTIDGGDAMPIEVGMKFKADFDGTIAGVRFYKAATNIGTHTGSVWSASGTRLGTVTFTNETASGWQTAYFATPVAVTAGTTYVVSYYAPSGHYSVSSKGLGGELINGPLHAIGNNTSPNGVYAYGPSSAFPTNSFGASNYWVDVLYALPAPGTPTAVSASAAGRTSASVTWTPPSGGGPVTSYRITPYIGTTAQTPTTIPAPATSGLVTGLTTGTTYTFKVEAVNANGPGPKSAASNSVTPLGPLAPTPPSNVVARPATASARVTWTPGTSDSEAPITSQTVTPYIGATAQTPVQVDGSATSATVTGLSNGTPYTFKVTATNSVGDSPASSASAAVTPEATIFDFATPTTVDSGDGAGIEVGVKFTADFNGSVTGIRFYKASTNTGTHTGSLWTAAGVRLAQATFTNETASGWQTVTFATPVPITPNTTYVASYYAPQGHYSATSLGLSSSVDNGQLHAVANATSPNGVYQYGATSAFPSRAFSATNYGVDVLFDPAPAPGRPTGVSATAGQAAATVSWTPPTDGGPVTSYRITPYIGSTAQTPTTVPAPASSAQIGGLTGGTTYTFKVEASNPNGTGQASAASNPVTPAGASAPGAPTGATAQADAKAAIVSWSAPASNGGSAITGYTVTPFIGATAQTPVQVGGSTTTTRVSGLTAGTSYTFSVSATNAAGTSPQSGATSAVTPQRSIFDDTAPAAPDSGDTKSTVVGVKFVSDVSGQVTGVRFYKSAANDGTHVGALWTSTGTLLAQATFTTETGTGWEAVSFSTPVSISAGTTYVASVLSPHGHYAVTNAGFRGASIDNAPLHGQASSTTPNGVYLYSATSAFPTSSFNSSNYWVDALFTAGGGT
jgi:hypothetical protein